MPTFHYDIIDMNVRMEWIFHYRVWSGQLRWWSTVVIAVIATMFTAKEASASLRSCGRMRVPEVKVT